ncbi:MAG: histidinol-phosphatase HisJ family protein [Oscillospiraceae bacterium]|nr:histidinol-phosphatase HisJ family protein [Oscillospiraceae bacterium]
MIMDLHTHTRHSPDAAPDTVAERVAAAEAMGLQFMAITDHVEINRYYPAAYYHAEETEELIYDSEAVFRGSVRETVQEQAHTGSLTLLCGAEVGQIPQDPALAAALYRDPRLDLVIGSVHELPGMPDFYFLDYDKLDVPALMTAYFEEELRLAETDCYDILGHLTYGLRYLPNRAEYDLTPHLPVIDEIFRTVIAKGKAIELNGSNLKAAAPFTDPDVSLIRRYRELGGRYLTLSTDAHETRYLGYKMDVLEQLARDAGFTELTCFKQHQPVSVPLEGGQREHF